MAVEDLEQQRSLANAVANDCGEGECWEAPKKPSKLKSASNGNTCASINSEQTPLLEETGSNNKSTADEAETADRKGLIISFVILLGSIPALIGAWCWPALVIGLLSGTVSLASRTMGHYISFAVTGSMMLCMCGYMLYCARTKRAKKSYRYVPFFMTVLASLLIMADLLRHVLQDVGLWKAGPWPGSSEYRADCPEETMRCLSPLGVVFTIICTYSGFVLLFVATMWNASMIQKLKAIRQQWRKLRSASSSTPTR